MPYSQKVPSLTPDDAWVLIAFSGHRRLKDEGVVAAALDTLIATYAAHGPVSGISSAAFGSDTLFAETMQARGLPFTLVLPFPVERFEKDFKNDPGTWERSLALFDKAWAVEVVNETVAPASTLAPLPGEPSADQIAYMNVAYRTLEEANVLVAVWDGQDGNGFGGTADVVRYAREIGLATVVIDPTDGTITRTPAQKVTPLHPVPPPTPRTLSEARQRLRQQQGEADEEAKHHGPLSRRLVRYWLQLHLLASAIGLMALIFNIHGYEGWMCSTAEFGIIAVATMLWLRRGKSLKKWVELRVRAELCTAFDAIWDLRGHVRVDTTRVPLPDEAGPLARDLALLRQLDDNPPPPFDEVRDTYDRDRLDGQVRYFRREGAKACFALGRLSGMSRVANALTLACSGTLLVLAARHIEREILTRVLEYLATLLPLATTSIGISLITRESARRSTRYEQLAQALEQLRVRLRASRTKAAVARVASDAEALLSVELLEWRSYIRYTRDLH